MIVFGTSSMILKHGELKKINCPVCSQTLDFNYFITHSYLHFYGIPTAASERKTFGQCPQCNTQFPNDVLPDRCQQKIKFENFGIKTPVKLYSGTILAVLGLCFFAFFSFKDYRDNGIFIKDPKVGDIYSFETEEGSKEYSSMKVAKVLDDSVFFFFNDWATDGKYNISQIDKFENYGIETYILTNKEIDSMFNSGQIYDIDRD